MLGPTNAKCSYDLEMDGPGDCQYYEHCLEEQQRTLFAEREGDSRGYADDATWILTSSFVIFTMQSGFGLLEAGSCSPGFEVNIMMKNIVDVVFTALSYYLVGYGISFGEPSTPFMVRRCLSQEIETTRSNDPNL